MPYSIADLTGAPRAQAGARLAALYGLASISELREAIQIAPPREAKALAALLEWWEMDQLLDRAEARA